VREGHRRNVGDAECQTCAHFEPVAGTLAARLAAQDAMGGVISGQAMALTTRGVLLFTAGLFAAIGFVTLTGPLAVLFTVTMWLCAAGFAGLATFWELPEN
jgi:hypothetical protein